MPFYRISFVAEGRRYSGIKESDKPLGEMYMDYQMKLNHRYGWGNVKNYDCVQLWEKSPEVIAFIEGKERL